MADDKRSPRRMYGPDDRASDRFEDRTGNPKGWIEKVAAALPWESRTVALASKIGAPPADYAYPRQPYDPSLLRGPESEVAATYSPGAGMLPSLPSSESDAEKDAGSHAAVAAWREDEKLAEQLGKPGPWWRFFPWPLSGERAALVERNRLPGGVGAQPYASGGAADDGDAILRQYYGDPSLRPRPDTSRARDPSFVPDPAPRQVIENIPRPESYTAPAERAVAENVWAMPFTTGQLAGTAYSQAREQDWPGLAETAGMTAAGALIPGAPKGARGLSMNPAKVEARAQALGHLPDTYYHGTTHQFDSFADPKEHFDPNMHERPLYEAESHHGPAIYMSSDRGDANMNYAGVGPDLTGRINRHIDRYRDELSHDEAEAKARAELVGPVEQGRLMPLRTNPQNPVYVGGPKDTLFTYERPGYEVRKGKDGYEVVDREGRVLDRVPDEDTAHDIASELQYQEEPTGSGAKILEYMYGQRHDPAYHGQRGQAAIGNLLAELQSHMADNEGIRASKLEQILRDSDALGYMIDYDISPGQFIQNLYTGMGHDAAILADAGELFPRMGIGAGTEHVALFDPRRVRSVDAKFDPAKKDSTDLMAGIAGAAAIPTTAEILQQYYGDQNHGRGGKVRRKHYEDGGSDGSSGDGGGDGASGAGDGSEGSDGVSGGSDGSMGGMGDGESFGADSFGAESYNGEGNDSGSIGTGSGDNSQSDADAGGFGVTGDAPGTMGTSVSGPSSMDAASATGVGMGSMGFGAVGATGYGPGQASTADDSEANAAVANATDAMGVGMGFGMGMGTGYGMASPDAVGNAIGTANAVGPTADAVEASPGPGPAMGAGYGSGAPGSSSSNATGVASAMGTGSNSGAPGAAANAGAAAANAAAADADAEAVTDSGFSSSPAHTAANTSVFGNEAWGVASPIGTEDDAGPAPGPAVASPGPGPQGPATAAAAPGPGPASGGFGVGMGMGSPGGGNTPYMVASGNAPVTPAVASNPYAGLGSNPNVFHEAPFTDFERTFAANGGSVGLARQILERLYGGRVK